MSKTALIGATRWLAGCLAALVCLWSPTGSAMVGTVDRAPAATLLLPYFEADLANPNGSQTSLRVSNASATAALLHATLYTDLGIPTLQFNLYLTGYDTVDLDLRLLFQGIVPQTASDGQDPTDRISPQGDYSQDINIASCNNGSLPPPGLPPTVSGVLPPNTTWDVDTLAAIRAAHTGQASTLWSGQCGAVAHGDNVARGYITIDTVNNCTMRYPSDPGYFQPGGTGDATMQNMLYGTATTINRLLQSVHTENLVGIEASPVDPTTTTSGIQTFYGGYNGNTAADNREAIGTVLSARSMVGTSVDWDTKLVVWRDPGQAVSPYTCGGALPAPFPLTTREVVAFDEEENPTFAAANLIPYATQLVDASVLSPNPFGIVRFDLSLGDGSVRQGHVSSRILGNGAQNAMAFPGALLMTAPQVQCYLINPPPAMCVNIPPPSFGVGRNIN